MLVKKEQLELIDVLWRFHQRKETQGEDSPIFSRSFTRGLKGLSKEEFSQSILNILEEHHNEELKREEESKRQE